MSKDRFKKDRFKAINRERYSRHAIRCQVWNIERAISVYLHHFFFPVVLAVLIPTDSHLHSVHDWFRPFDHAAGAWPACMGEVGGNRNAGGGEHATKEGAACEHAAIVCREVR